MPKKFPGRMTYTQWQRTPFRQKHRHARNRAQHQGVPLLARLRRRALPPRPLVPGSRMLLAAAAKTADTEEVSRVRKRAESWTWLLWEGSSKGSEGRKPY